MATDAISDLGESISCSGGAESLEPCLGDGAVKAGMACALLNTGKASAIDGDSATLGLGFVGIMDRHFSIDIDTVITDTYPNNLIVPKSGKIYRVFIEDAGATQLPGAPVTFGQTTAGSFKIVSTLASTGNLTPTLEIDTGTDVINEPIVAYLYKEIISTDLVAYIRWA